MKRFLSLLLAGGLVLGLGACSSDDDAKDSKKEDKKEEKAKTEYAIGETATVEDLKITVNSVRVDEGYVAAGEGLQYFVMDITIENTSDEEASISSLMSFELKDSDGRKQDLAIGANLNGSMDVTILPNETATGEIAFKTAPEGKLSLYFTDSFINGKTIKFIVR